MNDEGTNLLIIVGFRNVFLTGEDSSEVSEFTPIFGDCLKHFKLSHNKVTGVTSAFFKLVSDIDYNKINSTNLI